MRTSYLPLFENIYFWSVYVSKTPDILKAISSDLTWNKSREERTIYLTFDDGPTPNVTNRVLELLTDHNALATFFCVGEMIVKSPDLFQRIIDSGHSVGNHTMKHENGWKSTNSEYYRSFIECQRLTKSSLFRPPYGRISKVQSKTIKKRSEIIMWDVLPGDFDEKASAEMCVQRLIKSTQNGSIIVLHDSLKCGEKMLKILPKALDWFAEQKFVLKAL